MPEEWATVNCSSQQITLRRLDKAFQAFFARCAKGQTPGFPRFKSIKRMSGFGFKGHGDGWRFIPNMVNKGRPDDFGNVHWAKHGVLRLQGVGHIKVRGQARSAGTVKSSELMRKDGKWFVSLTLACADIDVQRERVGDVAMAADWGVSRLLTIMRTDGAHGVVREDIDNPRWYRSAEETAKKLSRDISVKKRYSNNWRKACAKSARVKAKLARKRHDHQHQLSAVIAANAAIFATEKLTIKNMSASAAGTVEEPGRNVAQKAGLNREILDTAPAALFQKIAYKVLETGGLFLEVSTRKLKPSQTCPECGVQVKKVLANRHHNCKECGYENDRDAASALVVLKWALGTLPELHKEKNTKVLGQELTEAG